MIPTHHLPHALLIQADPEAVWQELQADLKTLLCQGQVSDEQLFESEAGHPDLMVIAPEGKMNITIISRVPLQ